MVTNKCIEKLGYYYDSKPMNNILIKVIPHTDDGQQLVYITDIFNEITGLNCKVNLYCSE